MTGGEPAITHDPSAGDEPGPGFTDAWGSEMQGKLM